MTGAQLREIFGGRWDGGDREIHGLVKIDGRNLKIELLHASHWVCSVFEGGTCVAMVREHDAEDAVRRALDVLEP